jgi:hypothetical protein
MKFDFPAQKTPNNQVFQPQHLTNFPHTCEKFDFRNFPHTCERRINDRLQEG